jgi:hypothetical protein
MRLSSLCVLSLLILFVAATPPKKQRVTLKRENGRVAVLVDGQLFTAYIYPGPDVLKKPALYPILTATGNPITRGWPMDPRPGERIDHPHHVGLWFNYGDVNGYDFWNNSSAVDQKGMFGTIVNTDWQDKNGKPLLHETTLFTFSADGPTRRIDRRTTLKAVDSDVVFKDNKEGLMGLRLARQLEHPSTKPDLFTDASGKTTAVPKLDNEGVTGKYHSASGVDGDAVWGTRAPWVTLTGTLPNNEAVAVTLIDHPGNPGYPTYWHARGYGLFAANPLAPSVMSSGKDAPLNYTLKAGQSVTFRHRLLITPSAQSDQALTKEAAQFGK